MDHMGSKVARHSSKTHFNQYQDSERNASIATITIKKKKKKKKKKKSELGEIYNNEKYKHIFVQNIIGRRRGNINK